MKLTLFNSILFLFILNCNVYGQLTFSTVNLKSEINDQIHTVSCSDSTITIDFTTTHKLKSSSINNLILIDKQAIQITLLKYDGLKKNTDEQNLDNQKALLEAHSTYELNYFKNELGIEVLSLENQWVKINSKNWLIWYFKVGKVPIQTEKQFEIQLFATTVIGDKILIINAPQQINEDFIQAANIVNELMETIKVTQH